MRRKTGFLVHGFRPLESFAHLLVGMRFIFLFLALGATPAFAGEIQSFVNEQGVRVFTNAPVHAPDAPVANSTLAKGVSTKSERYRPLIEEVAARYGVDEQLVEAIISVESAYDPWAVSSKNCKGLMQLHPDTARRFGVLDIFNPADNIEGGVRYLQFLLETFDKNLEQVVAAYNAGENAVKKFSGIPPYPETQEYVKKVAALYDLSPPAEETAAENTPPSRKLYRIELPDGGVLYTNTP